MDTYKLQEKIHTAVKENLHIGMTEKELADVVSSVCPNWQGDIISGERSADIEGVPTDRVIKSGDVVLLDLQVRADGKWSDLTRVYFMGDISPKQRDAFYRVSKAIAVGERMLMPGCRASEVWHNMREAIDSPNAFTHHGGHRVGDEDIVAEPRFVPECEESLNEGMVVTLEPAIYYPGEFGIRLENNYLITKDGAVRLCTLSMDADEFTVKG